MAMTVRRSYNPECLRCEAVCMYLLLLDPMNRLFFINLNVWGNGSLEGSKPIYAITSSNASCHSFDNISNGLSLK